MAVVLPVKSIHRRVTLVEAVPARQRRTLAGSAGTGLEQIDGEEV
jgi:hypothetical protein